MSNPTHVHRPGGNSNELRLVTKALVFLALLTAILYLRVFVAGLWISQTSGRTQAGVILLAFLLAATLGLLMTFRWEGLGGLLAVAGGLGLGILVNLTTSEPNKVLTAFFYSSPFIISGALSVACWWQARR